MQSNYNLVDGIETRYFQTYQEFKNWLLDAFGEVTQFISEPIEVINSDNFDRYWKCISVFQSGNVEYKWMGDND